MIKNIVLDMGNVLLDYNPNVILDMVCENEEEKDLLYNELFKGEEWLMGDRGEITNAERYDLVKKRLPEKMWNKLKKCVEEWFVCMIPLEGAIEFCTDMKKRGYKLYVLSNACNMFHVYFPKYYPLEWFDGIMVSSDEGIIKPDVNIYKRLLERYSLKPEECLFIDDRQDNINGAKSAGMKAVVFTENYPQIRRYIENN